VPLGWGFDTRAIVLHLRTYGALPGILACGSSSALDDLRARAALVRGTDGCDLTLQVATESAFSWDQPLWRQAAPVARGPERGARIIVLDCGAKRSILRELVAAEARVIVVPPATSAAEVLALAPGGVVVSNGPGDPAAVARVTDTVRGLLGRVPVLGICLGHQLLARALGGRTYKLRFGHHGANHPVREEASGAVWITSQNHNYAVDADSLPAGSRVTLTNLTDGSVEGLLADGLEAEGIQFHPEAGPGPHDARGTFARFLARCRVSP
jgi:carbamoyl-phosphate synthase small subunit